MNVDVIVFVTSCVWLQTVVNSQTTWICSAKCVNNSCWSTETCMYGCTDGFWGSKCANYCPSSCNGRCDQNPPPSSTTNKPSCDKCPAGTYREYDNSNCTLPCPANCIRCIHSSACYQCQEGFYIAQGKYDCTSACPRTCKSCLLLSECIECIPPYYNTLASKTCSLRCPLQCKSCTSPEVCTECVPPYYNEDSVSNCSLHCPRNCLCPSPGVCAKCKDGFYDSSTNCTIKCPENCISCHSGTNCSSCITGKYSGYQNDDGQKTVSNTCQWMCRENCTACSSFNNCTTCVAGTYGQKCENECSKGCQDDTCEQTEGNCTCRAGFTGSICQLCEQGFHGSYCNLSCPLDCKENRCFRNNGTCVECKSANFHGLLCQFCIKGFYGENCEDVCSANCNNSVCLRKSGNCETGCVSNFVGDTCKNCVVGNYGDYCNVSCPENCFDNKCYQNNGSCNSCKLNFEGSKCDKCKNGQFGKDCSQNCKSLQCLDKVCNKDSGLCEECVAGIYGLFCNETCSAHCLGKTCHLLNGTCTHGCNTSYSGDKCCLGAPNCETCSTNTQCADCKDKFYGMSCNVTCPENCVRCSRLSGDCTDCIGDRYGSLCVNECPDGCSKITNISSCTIQDGSCTHGCKVGLWGTKCGLQCSKNCVNTTCKQEDGTCSEGCTNGYKGLTCTQAAAVTEEQIITGPAAGGGAAAAAVVAIFGVLVLVVIRRRNNPGAGKLSLSTICSGKRTDDDTFTPVPSGTSSAASSSSIKRGNVALPLESPLEDDMANEEEDDDNPKQDTYYNVSTKVKVSGLFDYVNKKSLNSYKDEFKHLPSDLRKPYNDARKPENQVKNRYTEIYPYDATRVKIKGDSRFFINACYIDGYKKERAYIASLGPTKKATEDFRTFWKMIWHEKSDIIVMLTNLQEPSGMKCEKYWPNQGVTVRYGNVVVKCLGEEDFAEYSVRTLNLTHKKETRSLIQFHYTAWPDKSVPDNVVSLVEFWQRVKGSSTLNEGPLVVHCSAGIGRTGTYIALDRLTKEGMTKGSVNIYGCVFDMREQRVNMVQTQEQYIYLHKALAYTLTFDCKAICKDEFRQYTTKAKHALINRQFRELQTEIEDEANAERDARVCNAAYSDLNRKGADIPGDTGRARLYLNKSSEYSNEDYINAVYVDSFKRRNGFLIAQTPLPSTLEDFVCLLFQDNCSCVISLDSNTTDGKDIGMYLPPDNQTLTYGPFSLTSSRVESTSTYTARNLTIKYSAQQKTMQHFQYTGWRKEASVPDSAEDFVQFIKDVNRKSETEALEDHRPVLVHCLNGAKRSGLFCVVFNLLEKVQAAGQASIVNTVRQIKERRKTAIRHKKQLLFCYQCVAAYIDLYSTYYNFEM